MQTIFNRIPLWLRAGVLVLVCAFGMGGIGYGVNDALNGVNEREIVQYERCLAGNVLRLTLQEEKREELEEVESHGVPYYEKFLNGTEAQIRELRQESIEQIEQRIHRFAPEPCKEVTE